MSLLAIKDSDGSPSVTLTLVVLPWLAMIGAFVWSVYKGTAPDYISFGAGITAIIGIWVGKKWIKQLNTTAAQLTFEKPQGE